MNKYLFIIMILFASAVAQSQVRDRNTVEARYKWNLEDLYPTEDAWYKAKADLEKTADGLGQFKGKLTTSADDLFKALHQMTEVTKTLSRLYSYANMASDEDTRVSKYLAMKQEVAQLSTKISAATSFVAPELLAADPKKIMGFVQSDARLAPYQFYIQDLLRKRAHRGSEDVEQVIAQSGMIASTASNIFSTFYNADFPFPETTLRGEKVKLNSANFSLYRASEDRSIRKQVFETFMGRLFDFQRTFGVQLYSNLQKDVFYSKVRKYNSSLESALDAGNIPTTVYHNLVSNINENIGTFHRYLNLRKRMMGLKEMHYYDLYAPLVGDVDLKYDVPTAEKLILESLAPLGTAYVKVVDQAFNERWIDMYPNEGKRSGAYSNGSAYDVHPYILMNYNGKYDDVSTLTHELGHTMHSYLTNQKQHFVNSNYSIFVAEVASTVNEALLNDYLLKQIEDDDVRLAILGNYLEGAKGTLFRQTQFAEFELMIHELVEKGQALTGDRFNQLYLELTRKYYGHDKGVCIVDDYIQSEWSFIPHFYYNFYVYQYATSFTASQAIAEKILAGDQQALQKYLDFLAAGSTKYPVDLLIDAGVDMNTTAPFDLTIQKMNAVMDEMERILDKKK
jgi:oligoendopeptidase F